MTELNPTAASLLGFLHGGEASGYELVETADLVIGDFWSLTRSQVYRELAALEGRGLVEAGPTGARSRRPYTLTNAGRAAFAAWVAQPPGPETIRYPLLLSIGFGSWIDPGALLGFVAEHRVAHAERLAKYEEMLAEPDMDKYQRATLTFGVHYESAVLAWIDSLPEILGG
ncbi:PadR family transcriptional regulator [Yinghuangia seranimata]|uniref:PadR family transcriptional regulator n=1 Tax=Yinghuangia seranimata TaxID=408067 RepID=UPI00248BF6F2|nr:helix-turn-helix transcriptional regulator [Yinghuangia seranimata]MDI2130736.1 helix-turn-helix transcriptional regulator [Yinghuangia seranimata]